MVQYAYKNGLVTYQPDDACHSDERVDHYKSTGSIIVAERIEEAFFFVVIMTVIVRVMPMIVAVLVSMSVFVTVLVFVICHSCMIDYGSLKNLLLR